jgi:hypothetical protein
MQVSSIILFPFGNEKIVLSLYVCFYARSGIKTHFVKEKPLGSGSGISFQSTPPHGGRRRRGPHGLRQLLPH